MHQQFPPRLFTMRTRAELIFYTPMVTYTKQPISIADQMTMLKKRGLLFDDEQVAVECLRIISYFRLANYWKPMESDSQEKLYAQLCCMVYLMNVIHPDNTFKQKLKSLLTEYPIVDVAAMGFPKLWYNEPLWR